jgi:hypothetical protein
MSSLRVQTDPDRGRHLLDESLQKLPACYRTAWAAAGVTRLNSLFSRPSSPESTELDVLGISVDAVWNSALRSDFNRSWLDSLQISCMDLLAAHLSDNAVGDMGDVEHVISAMFYCLEAAKSGDSQEVLRACSHVRDAIDEACELRLYGNELRVGERHHLDGAYPLVDRERERQLRDLSELQLTAAQPSLNVIRRLRDRAFAEATSALVIDEVRVEAWS